MQELKLKSCAELSNYLKQFEIDANGYYDQIDFPRILISNDNCKLLLVSAYRAADSGEWMLLASGECGFTLDEIRGYIPIDDIDVKIGG